MASPAKKVVRKKKERDSNWAGDVLSSILTSILYFYGQQ